MSITYPLTLPAVKSFASLMLIPDCVITRSESPFTLSQQLFSYGGERWRLQAKYPQLESHDYKTVKAFLLALRNGWGTFYFSDPGCKTPNGVATGTPLVNGGGHTGDVLPTKGWTPNIPGILKGGDTFQVGAYAYTVLQDTPSDSGGRADFAIWPSLRGSPADNAPLILINPASVFRLEPGSVMFGEGADKLYEVGFAAVEAI